MNGLGVFLVQLMVRLKTRRFPVKVDKKLLNIEQGEHAPSRIILKLQINYLNWICLSQVYFKMFNVYAPKYTEHSLEEFKLQFSLLYDLNNGRKRPLMCNKYHQNNALKSSIIWVHLIDCIENCIRRRCSSLEYSRLRGKNACELLAQRELCYKPLYPLLRHIYKLEKQNRLYFCTKSAANSFRLPKYEWDVNEVLYLVEVLRQKWRESYAICLKR